jgi:hypothetical protein
LRSIASTPPTSTPRRQSEKNARHRGDSSAGVSVHDVPEAREDPQPAMAATGWRGVVSFAVGTIRPRCFFLWGDVQDRSVDLFSGFRRQFA